MEGTRERKKRLTRDALATTALDLFLAEGYEGITVRRIAEAAGTSPRTFHRYFRTKEDVVFGDLDALGDSLEAHLAERPPRQPPFEALRDAIAAAAEDVERSASWRQVALKRLRLAELTPSVRARHLLEVGRWAERLARRAAIRDGRRRARVDELAIAHAGTAVFHHAARAWADAEGRGGFASRVQQGFGELRDSLERLRAPASAR